MDLFFVLMGGWKQFLQPAAELLVIALTVGVGTFLRNVE